MERERGYRARRTERERREQGGWRGGDTEREEQGWGARGVEREVGYRARRTGVGGEGDGERGGIQSEKNTERGAGARGMEREGEREEKTHRESE